MHRRLASPCFAALAGALSLACAPELLCAQSSAGRIGGAASRAAVERAEALAAQQRITTAVAHMQLLEQHAKDQSAALAQLESDIIAAHPEDSRLKQAIADVAKAEEAFAAAQRRVTESAAYKAAYAAALASPRKEYELPRVRKEFLERDREANDAAYERAAARKRLEVVRQEVLKQDDRWAEAVAELRSTKEALAQAKLEFENARLSLAAANSAQRTAAAIGEQAERAAAAQKLIQAAQKAAAKKAAAKNRAKKSRNRRR